MPLTHICAAHKAIGFLIKNGELGPSHVKYMGEKGIPAGSEAFLRGSISSASLILGENDARGEALKGI